MRVVTESPFLRFSRSQIYCLFKINFAEGRAALIIYLFSLPEAHNIHQHFDVKVCSSASILIVGRPDTCEYFVCN